MSGDVTVEETAAPEFDHEAVERDRIKKISFVDETGTTSGPEVHLSQRILIDDVEPEPYTIYLTEGWSVSGGGVSETIVSFCVRTSCITPPEIDERGIHVVPAKIAGRPVMAPLGRPWEEYQPDWRPDDPDLDLHALKPRLTRVHLQIVEVEIRGRREGEKFRPVCHFEFRNDPETLREILAGRTESGS